MNIALIGYGKMGKEIEGISLERNHNISLIIDKKNIADLNSTNLKNIDVAIEFTNATSAPTNFNICFKNNIPVISGSTGIAPDIFNNIKKQATKEKQAFFWASNFSIGVNITFEINKKLAQIMNNFNNYNVEMKEIHHIHKIDSPSGTAITLANEIINKIDNKTSWTENTTHKQKELFIASERKGETPGTHIVEYKSKIDKIRLEHEAFGRKGFALGSVLAAEFIKGKSGIFTMSDLMNF